MSDILTRVQSKLLAPTGLEKNNLQQILDSMLDRRLDIAELYFQSIQSENWFLEDSIVKSSSFHVDSGVGARALIGDKTGFAYANNIHLPALKSVANTSKCIAKTGKTASVQAWKHPPLSSFYSHDNPLQSLTLKKKYRYFKKWMLIFANSIHVFSALPLAYPALMK